MAFETIITAFADAQKASSAIRAVRALGIPASAVKRHPAELGDAETARAAVTQDGGIWTWLFGRHMQSDEAAVYEKAVESGGTVVSVSVMEEEAERVTEVLRRFEPLRMARH